MSSSSNSATSFTHIGFTKASDSYQDIHLFNKSFGGCKFVDKITTTPTELLNALKESADKFTANLSWESKNYSVIKFKAETFLMKEKEKENQPIILTKSQILLWNPDGKALAYSAPQLLKKFRQEFGHFNSKEMKQLQSFTNVSKTNKPTPKKNTDAYRAQITANQSNRKAEQLQKENEKKQKKIELLEQKLIQQNKEQSNRINLDKIDSSSSLQQTSNDTSTSQNLSSNDETTSAFPAWIPLLLPAGILLIYVAIRPKVQTWNILKPLTPIE